ncbi:PAS domain-containing protein [Algicella marina]|uniref:histidine kinase n=1 Tax=Algicella marina TaxID=2683284 RepID=A0A6P1SWT0_9RHOB|nr:PAS domain-containing protein [Algicella marina]QHQ33676.1 PAS domain-containing protein [Algicella marina]
MAEDIAQISADMPDSIAMQVLSASPVSIVLTNPHLSDNPIVYVNDAFVRTTGFTRSQAIGHNCRFLQGKETDRAAVKKISACIRDETQVTLDILNYRASGEPFWNRLMIAPLGVEGEPAKFFLGVQMALGSSPEHHDESAMRTAMREVQHRVKNHLAMIIGLIRIQARGTEVQEHFDKLAQRVESIQLLYEEMSNTDEENTRAVALGSYLSRIVAAISHLDGRSGVRVNVDLETFTVPMDVAVSIGQIVSELLTNAIQHAFQGRQEGLIEISVRSHEDGSFRIVIADDGIGLSDSADEPIVKSGLGRTIVDQLVRSLGGTLMLSDRQQGTEYVLDIPASTRNL